MDKAGARDRALEMFRLVRIPDPEQRVGQYPHEMSGGMRQRVMIAMALSCDPKILIADEPTTALDVTIQAQILGLMRDLRETTGAAVMIITHDMGVVAEVADDVVVMNQAQVVETGSVFNIFQFPQKRYTQALLAAVPRLGSMAGLAEPEPFHLVEETQGQEILPEEVVPEEVVPEEVVPEEVVPEEVVPEEVVPEETPSQASLLDGEQ